MPGVRSTAMISVRTTIYSLPKKMGERARWGALFVFFLLFILKKCESNDVEFDFSIGNALVIFPFL